MYWYCHLEGKRHTHITGYFFTKNQITKFRMGGLLSSKLVLNSCERTKSIYLAVIVTCLWSLQLAFQLATLRFFFQKKKNKKNKQSTQAVANNGRSCRNEFWSFLGARYMTLVGLHSSLTTHFPRLVMIASVIVLLLCFVGRTAPLIHLCLLRIVAIMLLDAAWP